MITIIFGPPRSGKTALQSALLSEEAFNIERIDNCRNEIKRLNSIGFNLEYPGYVVSTNFTFCPHKFGYTARPARRINPYRLGFKNELVETHFLPPFSIVGVMEGQKYFNSRLFKKFPSWQSRFYEMHGHNHLDFLIDTQRPNLIDINIRELANFIEVCDFRIEKKRCVWILRDISDSSKYDKYILSGKSDETTFSEREYTASIDILKFYDTREAKPLFYAGRFDRQFDKLFELQDKDTIVYYQNYCKKWGNELPKNFYEKE